MDYNYRNIIISGPPGPGKTSLTDELAKKTGFEIYYIGGIFRAEHKKLSESGKTNLPFEKWWSELSDERQVEINNQIKELAKRGGIIGDTRYAKICENTGSLHVFLYAPLETRVKRAVGDKKYFGKSPSEIEKILSQREEEEKRIGLKLFGIDYQNLNDYHLALNTEKVSVEEELEIIMSLMK